MSADCPEAAGTVLVVMNRPGRALDRNAPAGELTLERSKQVTVAGWQRPKKRPK